MKNVDDFGKLVVGYYRNLRNFGNTVEDALAQTVNIKNVLRLSEK